MVFNYIKTQFGKITFKQLVEVFDEYNSLDTSDGVELANQWNNVKDLLSNFKYSLYILFSKCPRGVQEKLLDVFGLLAALDQDAFHNLSIGLCEENTNKSNAFKTKLISQKDHPVHFAKAIIGNMIVQNTNLRTKEERQVR